jgi:3-oxoacyl-[acyl-carrier-protein] synthase II
MTDAIVITGGAAVRAPDLESLAEPVRARAARAERVTQLVLTAAGAALTAAGLAAIDGDPRAWIGIVLGTAFGCFLTNAAYQHRLAEGGPAAASPRLFAATVSNAAAGELAIAYRLGGPAVTLSAGGVSGLVAVGHAVDLLRAGQAEVVVAGGMDAAGEALARWAADGGIASASSVDEGAAVLVLEREAHATARRARVLGVVTDYTAGFDPDPDRMASSIVAARGPSEVLDALARLRGGDAATIAGRCATGHTAAVVVRKPA